ncbi:cysteine hydrolase family protein [Spongorhabdus nitratireducens]
MMKNKALLLVDLQNDYFPEGKFPLWNTDTVLLNIKQAISLAKEQGVELIHIQHIANPEMGISPFFNKGTTGAEIHPEVMARAPDAEVVVKEFADGFEQTRLESVLAEKNISELLICGMMTQNCVTHTAISKAAEKYKVSILPDCCTTISEMIHNIALHAVSTRVTLSPFEQALKA